MAPEQYARILGQIRQWYGQRHGALRLLTFEGSAQAGPGTCGETCSLMIAPDLGIYPCQRFLGQEGWLLGRVEEGRSLAELMAGPAAERMRAWHQSLARRARFCPEAPFCLLAGCPDPGGRDGAHAPFCRVCNEVLTRLVRQRQRAVRD
jgi:radical SAM protein with 4Fe4S-binding SPASM domain